ncbi:hypothetical protein DSCO28_00530 [Desulfosarcina ovata subsp. sediminis]|uniref:SWI2/SNF2 ATPase domain-containing protein n=1 Tax=Desulfosarcina ovata subsp. sediminis TaxID=885957 RepID=A0A5K7ZHR3_9BACT|nr:hypothetical protein [Desulfosarcina ovata]BBO79487.1 hypothetical protein DSCO28_00530 [Desulfosarcina ovata subsp. sediminis]
MQQRQMVLSLKVAEALGTYQAMPSGKSFGLVNDSERILLMIDEAHRTQGSYLEDNIFEAFPIMIETQRKTPQAERIPVLPVKKTTQWVRD